MSPPEDGEESTPLIKRSYHDSDPQFSVVRARIVSIVIPVLTMSAGSARDTLMAQYIVKRLSSDRGLGTNETDTAPCNVELNDSRAKEADELQAEASDLLTNLNLTLCIPAFFTCLIIGSYSDFLGRRLLLMFPVLSHLLRMALTTCIIKFNLDLNYTYIAYGIDGLAGSWFAILLGLFALTADMNASKHDRTFWIYFIGCATTIMSAGANVAVGYLIDYVDFFYACLLLVAMMLISFLVLIFTLQETLPVHLRPKGMGRNPLSHVRRIVSFYIFDGTVRRRMTFCLCLLLFVFGVANDLNVGSMDTLYQLHRPFCWSSKEIGNYNAIRSAGTAFLGVLLLKFLQCCMSDEKIGMIGILSQGVGFTFEAYIQVSWHFYFVPILLTPTSPFSAIVRTMMSVLAGPDQQGAVFSSIAVVETICNLVSTTAFNKIYAVTVSYMPGAVYLVMASCSYLTFLLFGVYFCIHERPQKEHIIIVNPEPIQETK
ncbi:unnamed protein product [Lymnaea stagnalis]|uniref:Proton-coupled folate transporter n=1 Tax=Lymnaea stagnalis TaxID=6523 RepID=A0AAV2HIJ4_LYMST